MNIVLLITVMFTFETVRGNTQPCKPTKDTGGHNRFVDRHILQESFDRTLKSDWEAYIRRYGLCNRPTQSFIEGQDQARVVQICNGSGRPLLNRPSYQGNLCMSPSTMLVYDLTVDYTCRVQTLVDKRKYVIVACDVINNRCLPVHFVRYTNQRPDTRARHCKL